MSARRAGWAPRRPASFSALAAALTLAVAASLVPATAAFAHPGAGIVVDRLGRVYFVAFGQSKVLRVDTDGRVTVFVDDDRLRLPHHLALDGLGNLYAVSDDDGVVWRIAPDGRLTRLVSGPIGSYGDPFTLDRAGNVYSIEPRGRAQILKIASDGKVTVFAGGAEGYADGAGANARFGELHGAGMAFGPDGALYVTDRTRLRKVTPDGVVTTVRAADLELALAMGVTLDSAGVIYVADYRNRRVVRIPPAGEVSLVRGSAGLIATGVAVGSGADILVLENPGRSTRVWRIPPEGPRRMIACVSSTSTALSYAMLALAGFLLLALAFNRAPSRSSWALGLVLTGVILLVLYAALGGTCVNEYFRYLLAPLFLMAVIESFRRIKRPAQVPTS